MIKNYLKYIDENPNHEFINEFNRRFGDNDSKFKLILEENVRPCFFSGNLHEESRIITISLNPAYNPGITEKAQEGKNFEEWYTYCLNRFDIYQNDKQIHSVFKNLFKVIAPEEEWEKLSKRKYLQENMVNLDWCYYYSENFPTIRTNELPEKFRRDIQNAFDKPLLKLIDYAKPRYIFVHGKTMNDWVLRNVNGLAEVLKVPNRNKKMSRLYEGKLTEKAIPVYYLEHFINYTNSNVAIKRINEYINQ
jgi:hypothetical protein